MAMPDQVAAVFAGYPPDAQDLLGRVRALVFERAAAESVGPLTETLKWGEPAYLTAASKAGTTVRLSWSPKQPDVCGMLVPCQTALLDRYRERFSAEVQLEGDRAVVLPLDTPLPEAPLSACIAMALTYHRERVRAHG